LQALAIGEDVDGAVAVGAEDADVGVLQAGEELGAGMAVGIIFAGGDDGDLRVDGGEEVVGGGIFAAVVADFEDVGVEGGGGIFGENLAFDLFFGVAREHESAGTEGPAHDDGVVVVGGGGGFGGGPGWVHLGKIAVG